MSFKALQGKKVAVLTETEYIPHELDYYNIGFSVLGATVDFMTNMSGAASRTIVSDVDAPGKQVYSMEVDKDPKDYDANDYDIVLMSANYCSVRLREIPPMGSLGSIEELQTPPAVQFFKKAMENRKIVKGALCQLASLEGRSKKEEGRSLCMTWKRLETSTKSLSSLNDEACIQGRSAKI